MSLAPVAERNRAFGAIVGVARTIHAQWKRNGEFIESRPILGPLVLVTGLVGFLLLVAFLAPQDRLWFQVVWLTWFWSTMLFLLVNVGRRLRARYRKGDNADEPSDAAGAGWERNE